MRTWVPWRRGLQPTSSMRHRSRLPSRRARSARRHHAVARLTLPARFRTTRTPTVATTSSSSGAPRRCLERERIVCCRCPPSAGEVSEVRIDRVGVAVDEVWNTSSPLSSPSSGEIADACRGFADVLGLLSGQLHRIHSLRTDAAQHVSAWLWSRPTARLRVRTGLRVSGEVSSCLLSNSRAFATRSRRAVETARSQIRVRVALRDRVV